MRRWGRLIAFLRSNVTSGLVLMAAACAALAWSNSGAAPSYDAMLHTMIGISVGPRSFTLPAHAWVNDALMAVFFLLVGLEIRHEMTQGELASFRRAAAPGVAALGGMAAPALIYLAFNHGHPHAMRGWAVPMATDIAFALAALNVLGRRVPISLKVFLTALAIIDDLGAIIVIALFYTDGLDWLALGIAGLALLAILAMGRAGVRTLWPFLLTGVVVWLAVFQSGIHATLAGVALAFVIPADERAGEDESPARRLEHNLQSVVAFAILPLFGLFNAGLQLGSIPAGIVADPVFIGILAGLVIGKQLGVFGVTFAAWKLRLIQLPSDLRPGILYGGSLLCGIGFTMSLFIGGLAFTDQAQDAAVKLAVFGASLLSAFAGLMVLRSVTAGRPATR